MKRGIFVILVMGIVPLFSLNSVNAVEYECGYLEVKIAPTPKTAASPFDINKYVYYQSAGVIRAEGQENTSTYWSYGQLFAWVWNGSSWQIISQYNGSVYGTSHDFWTNATNQGTVPPTQLYPGGCSQLNDPCSNYTEEEDIDSDGICDRCDSFPNDDRWGKYLYSTGATRATTDNHIVAVHTTPLSPDLYVVSTETERAPLSDVHYYDESYTGPITADHYAFPYLYAEMQPCSCGPCQYKGANNSNFDGLVYNIPDTDISQSETGDNNQGAADPQTAIADNQANPPGTYDTGTPGEAVPDPGTATDSDNIASTAGNQKRVADNTQAIANILENRLGRMEGAINGLESGLGSVASGVNGLGTKIDGVGTKIDGLGSKIDGQTDALGNKLDELTDALTDDGGGWTLPDETYNPDLAPEDIPEVSHTASELADSLSAPGDWVTAITGSGITLSNPDPCINIPYKGHDNYFCFDQFDSQFRLMGYIMLACSGITGFFIIRGK